MYRLAILSFHGCPVARLGEKDTGGMNVYVLQLAREFARKGISVDVFTRSHDPRDPKIVNLEKGARIVHLEAGPFKTVKENLSSHIPEFIDELYRFQKHESTVYDLVHSHYWLSGRIGMTLSRKWDTPHVTTFHTLGLTKLRARAGERESKQRLTIEGLIMRDVDSIIVSTDEEKQDAVRLYGADPQRVSVVPAGVDLSTFQPIERKLARERIRIHEKRIVLYVGRVEPLKGIDILLKATALLEDLDDTKVLIVGGNPTNDLELNRLKEMAVTLGISDKVEFTGAIKQGDLPNYYSAADVFVLPSHSESFGLAALEAMACGTPVVASRVGGFKTFIDSGKTGYMVPWRCPEPFAHRLEMLFANAGLLQTMGDAARVRSLEMGWDHTANAILDIYSSLLRNAIRNVSGN